MTGSPSISVVICTYSLDRWEDLARSVESVRGQTRAPHEIVVVTDHNDDLAARARTEWPDLRILPSTEPRGLSGARNAGLAAVEGEVVAFLDDDAAAAPDWLERLAAVYAEPEVIGAGGASIPRWDAGRPAWFPPEFDWVVGCSYRGMPESRSAVRNLIGSNMSFRTAELRQVAGFSSSLGRVGTLPAGCEETELCIRLGERFADHRILYEPGATVQHRVPRNRATLRYFSSRCMGEGRSKALVSRLVGARRGLATERSYTTRVLPRGVLASLGSVVRTRSAGGLGRAAMIVAGLLLTTGGYVAGLAVGPRPSR